VNIKLSGQVEEISEGFNNLKAMGFLNDCEASILANVVKLGESEKISLKVENVGKEFKIEYKNKNDFFRAISIAWQQRKNKNFEKSETACFEGCAAMIDLSRNAVYAVEEMKRLLCFMALEGFNRCYLYMEDTYEIPEYPYFGYFRGRYSAKELKEIDDFAFSLGIEAIPCIQTLAHLKNTLKWGYAEKIKDTDDILLVGEEETYRLIESMFVALKKVFRTRKIHIGMDEAMNLGRGEYFSQNGPRPQYDIMAEHLNKVNEIALKHGLLPAMWDDMFYRCHDKNLEYYNPNIVLSKENMNKVPENMVLVYWDYYHNEECDYEKLLSMRDYFSNDIIFAGGVWRWMGYVPMYSKTFMATNAALKACKKHKVKEIMATAWGDDGAETPIETIIPGLILFGEHFYGEDFNETFIDERCKILTGLSLYDFFEIEKLDLLPGCEFPNLKTKNPSKHILYQDILLGAFDVYFENEAIEKHYETCAKKLSEISSHAGDFKPLFDMYSRLADLLSKKSRIGIKARKAYLNNNRRALEEISQKALTELQNSVLEFKNALYDVWFKTSKGQGFEVLDIRLGGILSRIDTVKKRIKDYLDGRIKSIEELEEKPLPFTKGAYAGENYACFNLYGDIATQNTLL